MPSLEAEVGDEDDFRNRCFLCMLPIDSGQARCYHGKHLHTTQCWPDVKAARGQLQKEPALLEEWEELEDSDPSAWREKMEPFRTNRKRAREDIKTDIEKRRKTTSIAQQHSSKKVTEQGYFTLGEFITYKQSKNKFLTDEEIRTESKAIIDRDGDASDCGAEQLIFFAGRSKTVEAEGFEVETRVSHSKEISRGEQSALAEELSAKSRGLANSVCAAASSDCASVAPSRRLTSKQPAPPALAPVPLQNGEVAEAEVATVVAAKAAAAAAPEEPPEAAPTTPGGGLGARGIGSAELVPTAGGQTVREN